MKSSWHVLHRILFLSCVVMQGTNLGSKNCEKKKKKKERKAAKPHPKSKYILCIDATCILDSVWNRIKARLCYIKSYTITFQKNRTDEVKTENYVCT